MFQDEAPANRDRRQRNDDGEPDQEKRGAAVRDFYPDPFLSRR